MTERIEFDPYTVEELAAAAHDLFIAARPDNFHGPAGVPAESYGGLPESAKERERAMVRSVLYAIIDRELPPGTTRNEAALLLAATKAAAVHPGLLRWCDWPGCFVSYNAIEGPGQDGWIHHRSVLALLCPTHAQAGHNPSFDWDERNRHLAAKCSCGATEEVTPTNIEAVKVWWRAHVTQPAPAVTA